MLAEIKGKVNSSNTNLTELGEDELTGNFFGSLRYISFNKGLKQILRNAIQPTELRAWIDEIDANYWNDNLFLWDRVKANGKSTELDVRIDFEDITIGIEVKYRSGLSSDDDYYDEDDDDIELLDDTSVSAKNSLNQLSREARVLKQIAPTKKKMLLLLADDTACAKTVNKSENRIIEDVKLGYISWQEVLIQLKKLTDLDMFEQLVVDDLITLLERKGFVRFENFEIPSMKIIAKDKYWGFEK